MNTNGHRTLIDEAEELLDTIDLTGVTRGRTTGVYVIFRPDQLERLRAALDREKASIDETADKALGRA